MPFNPPKKCLIKSDDNEIEFSKTIKNKNELVYEYKFVKSLTKMDMIVSFSEKQLIKLLNGSFEEIK